MNSYLILDDLKGMQEPCRRRNLRFFDKQRLEIPYERVGLQRAASVSLLLRFSKTDQTGHGRIVQHESTDNLNRMRSTSIRRIYSGFP